MGHILVLELQGSCFAKRGQVTRWLLFRSIWSHYLVRLYPKCLFRVKIRRYETNVIRERSNHNIFLMIFAGITSKLENVGSIFSRFNPCSSLPSVATVACVQTSPPLSKNRRKARLRFLLRGEGLCTQAIATISILNIVLDNNTGLLFYWIQLTLKTRFSFLKR